ncbi:unnamed protein product [Closterium sp. NIES-53]
MVQHVHPDCINASNPYHECTDYCFRKIAERKGRPGATAPAKGEAPSQLPTSFGRQEKVRRKYDEVVVDERKAAVGPGEEDLSVVAAQSTRQSRGRQAQRRVSPDRTAENDRQAAADVVDVPSYEGMDARQKKLFEIRLKLNQARKANQTAVVAEKRREEKPEEEESRGVSKAAWFEEKKRKMSKQLDAAGLDITKAYMLETQEAAESKYKKWEKKEAPFGWDAFNQQALYNAYKKRTGNIPYTEEDYLKAKEKDPDFYRDDASLQYGQAPDIPEENVDRMWRLRITWSGVLRCLINLVQFQERPDLAEDLFQKGYFTDFGQWACRV